MYIGKRTLSSNSMMSSNTELLSLDGDSKESDAEDEDKRVRSDRSELIKA